MSQQTSLPIRLMDWLVRLSLTTGLGSLVTRYLARQLTSPMRLPVRRTPDELGFDWEERACVTADGYRLRGWVISPACPVATILLFHGLSSNREQMLSRIAFLASAGYRCVAFDHRTHGESEGRISSFGYMERHDVRAVLSLTQECWPDQPKALLGLSMGAAAICFAAEDVAARVRGVILESLYHDILSAFSNRLQAGHYPPYYHRLTRGVIRHCERRVGVSTQELTPAKYIGSLSPTSVLFLTGQEDRLSTPEEAALLFALRRGPGELFLVPSAGHEDVCETGKLFYQQRILAFLSRCFSRSKDEAA